MTTFASTFLHQRDELRIDARAMVEAIGDPQETFTPEECCDPYGELMCLIWVHDSLRGELPGPHTGEEAYGPDYSDRSALDRSEHELLSLLERLVPAPRMDVVPDPWPVAS